MKTQIVRIGNSQGIRIPREMLEQSGLEGEVEITVQEGALVIRAAKKARAGWAAAFEEMARSGDDALVDDVPPSLSRWDEDEWEWR